MLTKTFIYALVDPVNGDIRYIGKANDPKARYRAHLRDGRKSHKTNWICKLLRDGRVPGLVVIEETDTALWEERERFWIRHYRDLGVPLVNDSEGGNGCSNPSKETRAKRSLSLSGHSVTDETRKKISLAMTGRKANPEAIGKLRLRAISPDSPLRKPESIKKHGASIRGVKHTKEHNKKISGTQKGRPARESFVKMLREHPPMHNPESLAKMVAHHGMKRPEISEKISKALSGRKLPDATKEKIRQSMKAFRERQRVERTLEAAEKVAKEKGQ